MRNWIPIAISILFHLAIWDVCQQLDHDPIKPPEHLIEAELVTLPRTVSAPPVVPSAPPEPRVIQPTIKQPEKPKATPKPKPITKPAPIPEPLAREPLSPVQSPIAPVEAAPVKAPPPPEPVTPASVSNGNLRSIAPHYPSIARERHWTGTTILEIKILANGNLGYVKIFESSGHDVLDEEAIEAVKNASWTPAKRGSTPIDQVLKLPFKFGLTK